MILGPLCSLYFLVAAHLLPHFGLRWSNAAAYYCSDYYDVNKLSGSGPFKVVCYFSSDSVHAIGKGKFLPKDINTDLCTHINFAFANIKDGILVPSHPDDLPGPGGEGTYALLNNLKKKKTSLKIILSVVGTTWSEMVATQSTRAKFILQAVQFMKNNSFDGLDLDWEFPGEGRSPPQDKHLFTLLLKEIREHLDTQPSADRPFLLTAATSARKSDIDLAYEVKEIVKYVDFLNVMGYDFYGYSAPNHTTTNIHCDLYHPKGMPKDTHNQDFAVKYWLSQGAPADKIVLGMGLYGRTYTLSDPSQHGIGANATGPGIPGNGWRSYYQIAEDLNDGWNMVWKDDVKSCYSYHGDQWVGFDNVRGIKLKAEYVRDHRLAGAMVWTVDQDDFTGSQSKGQKFPMLTAINDALYNNL